MAEYLICDEASLNDVIAWIRLGHGTPLNDVRWEKQPVEEPLAGWLVRFTFSRPDSDTGKMGRGCSRWEFVQNGATESAVVKTLWLLCELTVRHELMESFQYRGVRIFNPHHTVDELSMPARAREAAGG